MTIRPLILAAALATATPALAQKPEIFTDAGAAIRGYDPVAYFTEAKPVRGEAKHTHQWQGATWRFASRLNRDAFAAAPERYAPQYGGYCAYGVANSYTVSTAPEAWSVRDGKLYLNYSTGVKQKWLEDPAGYIGKADTNWPKALER
jgi:YHS domain-containing protein